MDIVKKSKEYAEGKALEAISSAIEQAYADGYKDGLHHLENERLESLKTGVTYVDLGLPSGTLWSSQCLTKGKGIEKLPYLEAAKLKIPTVDQYEELCNECKIVLHHMDNNILKDVICYEFIGKNGKSIFISSYMNFDINVRDSYYFWLKDDDEGSEKDCACLWGKEEFGLPFKHKVFMGLKSPVMLVK